MKNRSRTGRLQRLAATASALVLAAVAPAGAQEVPPGYEQGIFQLSIAELPRVPIGVLVAPDGELLFPVLAILRAAEVPVDSTATGYTVQLLDYERRTLPTRVDTTRLTITRGQTSEIASRAEMIAADDDVYLTPRLLAFLLSAEVHVDFSALDLHVDPYSPVPAEIAQETERRRQLALIRAGAVTGPQLPPTPLRNLTDGGVLHYSVSSAAPDTRDATVLTLEAGVALLGGLAAVGYTAAPSEVVVDPNLTYRYERFIPGSEWISFVRAGDVLSEGAFLRSIRGLTVTNRPLRREGYFQDIVIDPEVPPGFEVEVYQGGQLIAFSDRSTQGAISVPLGYGRTDFEVRMRDPSGAVTSTGLLFSVPQNQLPEGGFEYAAGGGWCHYEDCELGFAVADYGVRRWLTLGAGYEAAHDPDGYEHMPFGRVGVAPTGGWLGEARVVGDQLLSASLQYNGLGPLTGNLGVDVRSSEVPRATVLPQTETRWDTRGELGYRGHRALGRLGGMDSTGIDRWALGYIAAIPRGVLISQVESFAERPTELSLTAFQLLRARFLGSRLTASGRLGATRHGVNAVEVGTSASWRGSLFGNLTVGWAREADFNLTLSFSRILPVGQIAGIVTAADHARATLRADGAIAIDRFDAVEPAAYTGIGFAGVDAFAFRDLNGNGERDAGEPPASGVSVQAGERDATTDSSGHARIWGLLPWETTLVRASPDWQEPQWAPATPQQFLRPVAHAFNPIVVALVATREFVAYVVPGAGIPTTASVGYRLVSETSDRVWQGLTLSDGSIYVSGVPVGPYSLELDPEALRFLRAAPLEPIRFTIQADAGDQYVFELPPIELRASAP